MPSCLRYSQLSSERMHRQPLHIEEAYQTTPNTPHRCRGAREELVKHGKTRGGSWGMSCCSLRIYVYCLPTKKTPTFTCMKAGIEWRISGERHPPAGRLPAGTKGPRASRPCPNTSSPHSLICFLMHPLLHSSFSAFQCGTSFTLCDYSAVQKKERRCGRGENSCKCFNVRAGGRLREEGMRSQSRITLMMNTNLRPSWLLVPCSLFKPSWMGKKKCHTVASPAMKNWSHKASLCCVSPPPPPADEG